VAALPSVVFPTGALPELIAHEEDGWVCAEVSASALAEGVEYFLKDPVRMEHASAAAQKSAERFSRQRFAEAWWAVFTGL
jgi:glycosyltransferase involved in cell wall biosynthesis